MNPASTAATEAAVLRAVRRAGGEIPSRLLDSRPVRSGSPAGPGRYREPVPAFPVPTFSKNPEREREPGNREPGDASFRETSPRADPVALSPQTARAPVTLAVHHEPSGAIVVRMEAKP